MKQQFLIKGFKELKTGNRDYGRGIVRLSERIAHDINLSRHGLVRLKNLNNAQTKYALFRPHNDADNIIGLEYDDRLLLGLNEKNVYVLLEISRASPHFYFHYFFSHPDVNLRLTFLFGIVISILSTILGFLLGLLA